MILLPILFTVSIVLGLTIARQDTMVLNKLFLKLEATGKKIYEPILVCYWCMPSIYSLFGILIYFGFTNKVDFKIFYLYPVIVGASSFIVGTLWNLLLIVIKKNEA